MFRRKYQDVDKIVSSHHKGSFTRTVNATNFVSGTFDLFDTKCKQHHRTALTPFLKGTKNGDVGVTCKRSLNFFYLSDVVEVPVRHFFLRRRFADFVEKRV